MEQECRFSAVMGWLLPALSAMRTGEEVNDLLYALERGIQNTETGEIPAFVLQTFKMLPTPAGEFEVPNYIRASLQSAELTPDSTQLAAETLNTFIDLWKRVSQRLDPAADPNPLPNTQLSLTVLEPACGSANDYRFIHAAGLTSLLEYTGIDLCEKNIQNARALFPNANFRTGNVFEFAGTDQSFDVCFFHDLLEHLSPEGLNTAVREICRVTRYSISAGFFQMHDMEDHVVREVDDYHLNTLSLSKTCQLFEANGFSAAFLSVAQFLRERFGCEFTHNPNAWTLVLTRFEPSPG
jgi:SAM-dependent methyltransferase